MLIERWQEELAAGRGAAAEWEGADRIAFVQDRDAGFNGFKPVLWRRCAANGHTDEYSAELSAKIERNYTRALQPYAEPGSTEATGQISVCEACARLSSGQVQSPCTECMGTRWTLAQVEDRADGGVRSGVRIWLV